MSIVMTAPMVDYKIHWLKMMSVPESRAVVGRHDGINGRDNQIKSTTVWVDPSSTGVTRRRGTLRSPGLTGSAKGRVIERGRTWIL